MMDQDLMQHGSHLVSALERAMTGETTHEGLPSWGDTAPRGGRKCRTAASSDTRSVPRRRAPPGGESGTAAPGAGSAGGSAEATAPSAPASGGTTVPAVVDDVGGAATAATGAAADAVSGAAVGGAGAAASGNQACGAEGTDAARGAATNEDGAPLADDAAVPRFVAGLDALPEDLRREVEAGADWLSGLQTHCIPKTFDDAISGLAATSGGCFQFRSCCGYPFPHHTFNGSECITGCITGTLDTFKWLPGIRFPELAAPGVFQ